MNSQCESNNSPSTPLLQGGRRSWNQQKASIPRERSDAPRKTKISFYSYVYDASKLEKGAGAGLDKVEMEDEEVVEGVQKGVRSHFYKAGRFSPTREKGVHHFHQLLAQFLNA